MGAVSSHKLAWAKSKNSHKNILGGFHVVRHFSAPRNCFHFQAMAKTFPGQKIAGLGNHDAVVRAKRGPWAMKGKPVFFAKFAHFGTQHGVGGNAACHNQGADIPVALDGPFGLDAQGFRNCLIECRAKISKLFSFSLVFLRLGKPGALAMFLSTY